MLLSWILYDCTYYTVLHTQCLPCDLGCCIHIHACLASVLELILKASKIPPKKTKLFKKKAHLVINIFKLSKCKLNQRQLDLV